MIDLELKDYLEHMEERLKQHATQTAVEIVNAETRNVVSMITSLSDEVSSLSDEMKSGFSRIEGRLDAIGARLDLHGGKFRPYDQRDVGIRTWMSRIDNWSEDVGELLSNLQKRVGELEKRKSNNGPS
jgi:phage shock protein A